MSSTVHQIDTKTETTTQARAAYVYAILVDGVVRYIGKGRGRRIAEHVNIIRRLRDGRDGGPKCQVVHRRAASAVRSGASVRAMKMVEGLDDESAYLIERDLIGTYPEGHLWNVSDGGEGCSSSDAVRRWADPSYREKQLASARSPETVRRKSEAQRVSQNIPEVRERVRAAQREAFARPACRARLVARTKRNWESQEYRDSVVAGRKAQWTQEARAKQSATHAAKWTPEHRAQRSADYKIKFQNPEWKARWLARQREGRKKKAVA